MNKPHRHHGMVSCLEAMLNSGRMVHFGRAGEHTPDRLIHGDNLPLLATLADESLDVVYVDPPFATGSVRRGGGGHSYSDRSADPEHLVDWLLPRLEHTRRVLTSTGSLFVHLDYRATHYMKVALDKLFGRSRFVNEIVWCYSVGGKSNRRFARKHDTILWYARSADYAFYPDAVRVPRKPKSHMRLVQGPDGELVQEKTDRKTGKVYRYPVARGKVPEDWWTDIETLNRADRERTGWPTQKPERLLERILVATSTSGDVVGDWFCGSGTTAVVAQRLDRRFIAIDAEPDAVGCSAQRLERSGRALSEAALAGGPPPPRDLYVETLAVASQRTG